MKELDDTCQALDKHISFYTMEYFSQWERTYGTVQGWDSKNPKWDTYERKALQALLKEHGESVSVVDLLHTEYDFDHRFHIAWVNLCSRWRHTYSNYIVMKQRSML